MVTITIDEITLNATRAALDLRSRHLRRKAERFEQFTDENGQRALVWTIAALHETELAREFFSEVQITDHPVDATWTAA